MDDRENAQEGPPAPRSEATTPTDEDLLAFLRERPGRSLADICHRFAIPYQYTPAYPRRDGATDGYTDECRAIRNQLQRLRLKRRIRTDQGQRWRVW